MRKEALTESAFEGFRITRENPGAVALWAIIVLIGSGLMTAAIDGTGAMADIMAAAKSVPIDQAKANAAMVKLLPALRIVLPVSLIMPVFLQAAINRAVLRPAERGFGYLGLGMDEGRTFLVRLAIGLILAAIYVVTILIGAVLAGALGSAGLLIAVLAFFAMLAAMAFVMVRLSMAVSSTIAERRMSLMRSWSLSRRHFWPLVAVYVIAGILALVVLLLGQVIASAIGAAMGLGPASSVADMLKPAGLVVLLITAILQTMAEVIIYAASAGAYKVLTANEPADTF